MPIGRSLALIGHNGSGKTHAAQGDRGDPAPDDRARSASADGSPRCSSSARVSIPSSPGKENVYLNASFLGLSRRDTDRVYDDVVAFAELEDFMGTAVKFYSSGMLVRLGFAVAVHVDPEVLLIDEVLAVGDEAFQARCIDRVRGFQKRGAHDRARHATRSTPSGSSATRP